MYLLLLCFRLTPKRKQIRFCERLVLRKNSRFFLICSQFFPILLNTFGSFTILYFQKYHLDSLFHQKREPRFTQNLKKICFVAIWFLVKVSAFLDYFESTGNFVLLPIDLKVPIRSNLLSETIFEVEYLSSFTAPNSMKDTTFFFFLDTYHCKTNN